jgi:hypothetical protein
VSRVAPEWVVIDAQDGSALAVQKTGYGCVRALNGMWGKDAWTAFEVTSDDPPRLLTVGKGISMPFRAVADDRRRRPDVVLCLPVDHHLVTRQADEAGPPEEWDPLGREIELEVRRPDSGLVACTRDSCVFKGHYGPCPPKRSARQR